MAKHASIGEFEAAREDWTSYTERLQQYFTANDVDDAAKQRAILLSGCGAPTYQLIRNLVSPAKPADKSFTELVKLVKDHHNPQPSVIVQRFNFHSRSRREGESVSEYVAELRKLSEHCTFGDSLNDMLRDRVVCGINDQRIQRRLLSESDLTYAKAFELAQSLEAAARNSKDLLKSAGVHTVRKQERSEGPRRGADATCYRCGGKHMSADCRFKEAECYNCGKKGHLSKVCRSKQKKPGSTESRQVQKSTSAKGKQRSTGTHCVTEDLSEDDTTYSLFHTAGERAKSVRVTVTANQAELQMEVDTGAAATIISETTYRELWPAERAPALQPSKARLRTYTGEELEVRGSITILVEYQVQKERLRLLVVAGSGPSLLGRDWLQKLRLDWHNLFRLQEARNDGLQTVLDRHAEVFKDEMGLVTQTAKIHVDAEAQPRFCKPRPVPYSLRAKVEQELDRLETAGIIEPIQFSKWAAPIVPVLKRDGSVRICGDYKVTVNRAAKLDTYPLPLIEDLFASLNGGKSFTKLDLAHAYQQVPLDDESKDLVAINTQKGLYRYNRLPFGVASAPAIFQRIMEGILRGIPGVCVYLDDILVTGKSEEEHLKTLEEVLSKLEAAGVRLKKEKCAFMMPKVEYLGHSISSAGLQPTQEKVRAIVEAPAPQDVSQLRSFLGLINYYGKFLPNLSSTLAPLYRLLHKETEWSWGTPQEKAFEKAKQQLTSSCLLVHYDPGKDLILACDASPYGVGAVLSHRMEDGSEKPVAFASRSLSPAEKKYAHLDKEGLAIVFGVKRFHQYLLGRRFTILSDHKPLQHIFSETRAVPTMASARIQRWALTLSAYDYTISYKAGEKHANADSLSRLPLPEAPGETPTPQEVILMMETLQATPVNAAQIKSWTDRDPVLSRVRNMVSQGWRDTNDEELRPFNKRKEELSTQDGCVLWGSRVIVPQAGRTQVLEELHEGHPGISRMKSLARSVVWWPGIDKQIEDKVKGCQECQQNQKTPALAPLHPWEWPERPWARIHIDYAGPFLGKMFLVIVDAHSKWLIVETVTAATSQVTIQKLRAAFANHGLPDMIVSDNGAVFTSSEFREFTKRNGVRHVTSAPYHPASNGLAERAVQTFKEGMKKTSGDVETRLSRFLFHYRSTPHSTTGVSPAELLMGRRLRSHLDLLHPDTAAKVKECQRRQKTGHDQHAKERVFATGDLVFAKNFAARGPTWLPGTIVEQNGPHSFKIQLEDGRVLRRHIDQFRARSGDSTPTSDMEMDDDYIPTPRTATPGSGADPLVTNPTDPELRRSSRLRRPPDRFGCSVETFKLKGEEM